MSKIELLGAEKGPCPLCLNGKEKNLFVIAAPGYPPLCCGDHLYVIAGQLQAPSPAPRALDSRPTAKPNGPPAAVPVKP